MSWNFRKYAALRVHLRFSAAMVNGDVVLLVVGSLESSQILHTIRNSIIDIPNVFVAGLKYFSGLNSIRHVRPCRIEFRIFRI